MRKRRRGQLAGCVIAVAALACGKTRGESSSQLLDSGAEAPDGATGSDGAGGMDAAPARDAAADADPPEEWPILPPCAGEEGSSAVELVARGQRSPFALIASAAGLAWLNNSQLYGMCHIRGCSGHSDGEVVSLLAGEPEPMVVATGKQPTHLAATDSTLFFDFWQGSASGFYLTVDVGTARRDGMAAAVLGNLRGLTAAFEADGTEAFAVLVAQTTPYYSVVRSPAEFFADAASWDPVPIEGVVSCNDTAIDRDSLYVASYGGVLAVDRDSLVSTWVFGPQLEHTAGSVAVNDTDVFYTLGEVVESTDDLIPHTITRTIARTAKDGSAAQTLLTDEDEPRDLEVDSTHVYWLANAGGCSQVRRIPRTGGAPEVILATSDDLTSLSLHEDWIYVTIEKPGDDRVPPELPPPTGRVLRVAKNAGPGDAGDEAADGGDGG